MVRPQCGAEDGQRPGEVGLGFVGEALFVTEDGQVVEVVATWDGRAEERLLVGQGATVELVGFAEAALGLEAGRRGCSG